MSDTADLLLLFQRLTFGLGVVDWLLVIILTLSAHHDDAYYKKAYLMYLSAIMLGVFSIGFWALQQG